MERFRQARRRLLKALGGLGAAALFFKYLSPRAAAGRPVLTVPKAKVPEGGALVYRRSRVAVVRRGEELFALSLICTHLGCTVNVTPTELVCPCHGSVFDRQGKVLKGPADRPLKRLAVRDDGDTLVVLA